MRIQELTEYLDTYLRAGEFHDYAPNGLQVEGTREVEHIVLGVSASLGLIDEAARRGADVVLVHHGWFLEGGITTNCWCQGVSNPTFDAVRHASCGISPAA